jgi:hypothetical protein
MSLIFYIILSSDYIFSSMNITDSQKIMGIPEGIYYGQFDRTDELNHRLGTRHFPDIPLQPNYDPRPVQTKYAHFPGVVNSAQKPTVPIIRHLDHVVELNFNPGSARAPVHGYFNNIDKETILRNQAFALQHGADQGVYVPSSESDLYKTTIVSRPGPQPHPALFAKSQFAARADPVAGTAIGRDVFCNHTRTQLRASQP